MIEADELKLPGIAHGFFTRAGGHSTGLFTSLNCGMGSGDDPELVAMNRGMVARALGVAEGQVATAYQVHSAVVTEVTAPWATDLRPKLDGVVSRTKGIAIGVLTADCGPVLFAEAEAGLVGACHAGWKGALLGITDATIAMMEKLGAKRERLVAVLGPTIGQGSYEVGPELLQAFLKQSADHSRFFKPSVKDDHHMFDLPGYLMLRLKQAGVGVTRNLGLDTYADEAQFYSYRRATHRGEKDYGRLMSAIALV
jgi:YfiH family protein